MASLAAKKYIVTGGSRGIGLAICKAIIDAGGHVAILDILPEPYPECRKLMDESGRCHYFVCDTSQQGSLEKGFSDSVDVLGGSIDGCVANAGVGADKPFLDHTWEDFDRIVKVNQAGTFFLAQLTVRQLLKQPNRPGQTSKGSIVMISSAVASHHAPGHYLTMYAGSKGFIKSFCSYLSHEVASLGIRVNTVSPGYINTEMNSDKAKLDPGLEHYFQEAPPMKRIGQPHEVAAGVVYLLSDAASYVTGHNLAIDGGLSVGNGLTK